MKNILVTGGSGFIGANLCLELKSRYPHSMITVIDDFRGSSFKNLLGFKGDLLAQNLAEKCWINALADRPFDTIFHLASITDTTVLHKDTNSA